jgi:hypothetical protein
MTPDWKPKKLTAETRRRLTADFADDSDQEKGKARDLGENSLLQHGIRQYVGVLPLVLTPEVVRTRSE